jgi:sugar lactone lactonase YvrE
VIFTVDGPPLAQGFQTPEAPRWYAGRLWFSDIRAGRMFSMTKDGGDLTLVAEFDEPCSGIGFTADGTPLVTLMPSRRIVRVGAGGPSLHADLTGLGGAWVNDMASDGAGRCYVDQLFRRVTWGTPELLGDGTRLIPFAVDNLAPAETLDRIVLVDLDGNGRVAADGLHGPNGIAVSPDGERLIVAEYQAERVTTFRIDSADGSLSDRSVLLKLPEGRPDGLCVDGEGGVWCAVPAAGECIRISPAGEVTDVARPRAGDHPMSCVLGGGDGRTLFMTTNCRPQPTAGYVEAVQVAIAGLDPKATHPRTVV